MGGPPKSLPILPAHQALAELWDKVAFDEGKTSFRGKNAAAAEIVFYGAAPLPRCEERGEAKCPARGGPLLEIWQKVQDLSHFCFKRNKDASSLAVRARPAGHQGPPHPAQWLLWGEKGQTERSGGHWATGLHCESQVTFSNMSKSGRQESPRLGKHCLQNTNPSPATKPPVPGSRSGQPFRAHSQPAVSIQGRPGPSRTGRPHGLTHAPLAQHGRRPTQQTRTPGLERA